MKGWRRICSAAAFTGVALCLTACATSGVGSRDGEASSPSALSNTSSPQTASPTSDPTRSPVPSKRRGPFRVVKVTDGDTLSVRIGKDISKVRVVGINTPESVDPRRPVQCFGREASDKAKQLLSGRSVWLEADPSQSERDAYGRLLAFVWIDETTDFGLQMIREGYALEYTYRLPYRYQTSYRSAERDARQAGVGLWAADTCAGNVKRPA